MSKPLIFLIGFNKCGTTSFHRFFKGNGIKGIHWGGNSSKNIARHIFNNLMIGRDPIAGVEECTAFTDLSFLSKDVYIEGIRFYRQFYENYPNAYFILNTRDQDKWIKSRNKHGHAWRSLMARSKKAYGIDTNEEMETVWREQWDNHIAEVQKFFGENGGRLLVYNIEQDDPQALVEFLKPDFETSAEHWGKANSSTLLGRNRSVEG